MSGVMSCARFSRGSTPTTVELRPQRGELSELGNRRRIHAANNAGGFLQRPARLTETFRRDVCGPNWLLERNQGPGRGPAGQPRARARGFKVQIAERPE